MFLGATFVDRSKVKIEHIVILLGKGANGKSVVQQCVCGVLGEEYVSTMEVGRLCSRGIDGDMAVAEINGKRLNYCTEMEETDFYRKSARLKAIVSGENVTARQLYGNPFKALNIPLLMANANKLPFFNKKDEAMLRRVYVIPFNVTIPEDEQDKSLGDRLAEEYPAILNWILEGRRKFIDNGYRLPTDTSLQKYVEKEKEEYNNVLKFMSVNKYLPSKEGTYLEPLVWRTLNELYNDYVRWCQHNYLIDIATKTVMKNILLDAGYFMQRKSQGVSVALYGNAKARITRMKQNLKLLDKKDPNVMWVDGVGYLTQMTKLAQYTGVSRHVLNRVKGNGYLNDCIKQFKGKTCYNVAAITEVLRRMNLLSSDQEKEEQKRQAEMMHRERNRFNARMKARGWPYRKYATDYDRLEEGVQVVPDYTTDNDCLMMAREAGLPMDNIKGIFKDEIFTGFIDERENYEQEDEQ